MKHELKQNVERPYTLILENGQQYGARFKSLRPARKWAKQLGQLTGQGVVLADFRGRAVLVLHRKEIQDMLTATSHLYKRSLTSVHTVSGDFRTRKDMRKSIYRSK